MVAIIITKSNQNHLLNDHLIIIMKKNPMYFPLEMRKDTFYFCFNVAIWGLHRRKNECGSVKIQEKKWIF